VGVRCRGTWEVLNAAADTSGCPRVTRGSTAEPSPAVSDGTGLGAQCLNLAFHPARTQAPAAGTEALTVRRDVPVLHGGTVPADRQSTPHAGCHLGYRHVGR